MSYVEKLMASTCFHHCYLSLFPTYLDSVTILWRPDHVPWRSYLAYTLLPATSSRSCLERHWSRSGAAGSRPPRCGSNETKWWVYHQTSNIMCTKSQNLTLIARFMGPTWVPSRQDPGGPHVGPKNFAIWEMLLISACSCLCPIHWSQVLSREWRCSWSSANRRCSNYIWVIDSFIAN